ncbi:hypothetical protein HK096_005499 [Nowakowskiella sp. JEL0078]|nr:hypothetical protein HK096_005499 [Nowakowskiella sp. JEL0078]
MNFLLASGYLEVPDRKAASLFSISISFTLTFILYQARRKLSDAYELQEKYQLALVESERLVKGHILKLTYDNFQGYWNDCQVPWN